MESDESFRQFLVGVKSGVLALREQLKLSNSVNTVRRRIEPTRVKQVMVGLRHEEVRGVYVT